MFIMIKIQVWVVVGFFESCIDKSANSLTCFRLFFLDSCIVVTGQSMV